MNGPVELRQALMKYSPQFVRSITEKLMTFALGRGVEYQDMPVILAILLGIVRSDPFQMRTKEVEEGASN